MRTIRSDPQASALMESTRSIGYNFNSAIADIIDNSIAAVPCNNIWIYSPPNEIRVSILDDGHGMDPDTLQEAMRYGVDPNNVREKTDLGRFGLGLKMASLSQCRQLSVVSKKNGIISACRWDLDYVISHNSWLLQILDYEDYSSLPQFDHLNELDSGTLVVWDKLDRLAGKSDNESEILRDYLEGSISYIGLYFHRFMDQSADSPISIYLNNRRIEPADPFLIHHPTTPRTIRFPEQVCCIDGHEVHLTGYVLPPAYKLSAEQRKWMGTSPDLLNSQGFYVYRNHRLIIPGTWFRLSAKKELMKYARVMVDIDSSADSLWEIDVKKSNATVPPIFREAFSRVMGVVSDSSESVTTYRGKKENPVGITSVWNRISERDGVVSYLINRDHPLLKDFMNSLDSEHQRHFTNILKMVELAYPRNQVYADISKGRVVDNSDDETVSDIFESGIKLLRSGISIDLLSKSQPWCDYPEILKKLGDYNE